MASEATKLDILGNMHIYSKVMEVIEHHMPISHSPCRRRSKGPLPSCSSLSTSMQTADFTCLTHSGPAAPESFLSLTCLLVEGAARRWRWLEASLGYHQWHGCCLTRSEEEKYVTSSCSATSKR